MRSVESIPAYSEFRSGAGGRAYNEPAFRHFLAIDRWRAERSARTLFLVLVSVRYSHGPRAKLTDPMAAALFRELGECIREVDFVGWYREGYVAAAVLTQGLKVSGHVPRLVEERVRQALTNRLPAGQSSNLHVRVVRLGARTRN
jgi:hypothetical protein